MSLDNEGVRMMLGVLAICGKVHVSKVTQRNRHIAVYYP